MTIWADQLIEEYSKGKRKLRHYRSCLDETNPVDCEDAKMVSGMLEDIDFAIEWLETGRQPGTFRGIDKRAVYQRRSLEAMDLIPDITEQLEDMNEKRLNMTREEKMILTDILSSFSLRERQCYILHTAQRMSMQRIADELGISKATVQIYINRARKKVLEKAG